MPIFVIVSRVSIAYHIIRILVSTGIDINYQYTVTVVYRVYNVQYISIYEVW